ncbi:MAG: hypothetical protein EBZ77_01980 [Chitinophagia bacterium]|nr:hypothetical protein [Chitinophagia bacterium]
MKLTTLLLSAFLCVGATLPSTAQIINTLVATDTSYGTRTTASIYSFIHAPQGIAFDNKCNLYIADATNHVIRKVGITGITTIVSGVNGTAGYSGDGGPATAAYINSPFDISFDTSGNMYIGDLGNARIRKVTPTGIISTIAGTARVGYSGDGGPATAAVLSGPSAVLPDNRGNIYLSDGANCAIRKINAAGIITTVVGGTCGFSGDGGPATAAAISNGAGFLLLDTTGNLYFPDGGNYRIRMVNTSGIISTIAGNGSRTATGDGGPATAASIDLLQVLLSIPQAICSSPPIPEIQFGK